MSTYMYGAFDCMFLSCHVHVSEWIKTLNVKKRLARSSRKIWWNLAIFNFEILILFFANQCTPLNNSSALPNNLAKVTNRSLDTVNFSTDDISKIIRSFIVNNLDPNKAHGHDMLSNRMIKLCGNSVCKPLSIIFNDFLKERRFPSDWKKAHVLPVQKKGDKQCLKNYRPISLLPICRKFFERLFYNDIFTIFTDNNLIYSNQSGFRSGDSCVDQLIAITHEMYQSFDDGLEVRGVSLDISKAFDRVWHGRFLLKLSLNGISGNLFKLLHGFLYCRKQRVAWNWQNSSWVNVNAGVPQGSILGALLFLVYINDLSNGVSSNCKLLPTIRLFFKWLTTSNQALITQWSNGNK